MKKLFLFLNLILAVAVSSWGATYYVNPTGTNSNSGTTAEAPWADLIYAAAKISAGDTVYIIASETSPIRCGLDTDLAGTANDHILWRGTSNSVRGYIAGSTDISEDAIIPDVLYGYGDMESWITSSDSVFFTEEGPITRSDAISPHGGNYCARYVRTANATAMSRTVKLVPETAYTLRYWHYDTEEDKAPYVVIKDKTTNEYLQSDFTWDTPYVSHNAVTSNGIWREESISFISQIGHSYHVWLSLYTTTTVYIDDYSIFDDATTYCWAEYSTNVYKLKKFPDSLTHLTKCTDIKWIASGVSALENVPIASNLENCVVIPGTWWWVDSTLYYHLSTAESIDDVHLEVGTYTISGKGSCFYLDESYNDLKYLNFNTSYSEGVTFKNGVFDVNNLTASHSGRFGFSVQDNGSVVTMIDCTSEYNASHDTFVCGPGTMILDRCLSKYSYDEGIEVYNGGTLIARNCIVESAGVLGIGDEGFSVSDNGTDATLFNCTVRNSAGYGISSVATNSILIIKNCLITGSAWFDVHVVAGQNNFIGDYNCYETATSEWLAQDGDNNIIATVQLDDNYYPDLESLLSAGIFISGWYDTMNGQRDYSGNFVAPYMIPIGAQGHKRLDIGFLFRGIMK